MKEEEEEEQEDKKEKKGRERECARERVRGDGGREDGQSGERSLTGAAMGGGGV